MKGGLLQRDRHIWGSFALKNAVLFKTRVVVLDTHTTHCTVLITDMARKAMQSVWRLLCILAKKGGAHKVAQSPSG